MDNQTTSHVLRPPPFLFSQCVALKTLHLSCPFSVSLQKTPPFLFQGVALNPIYQPHDMLVNLNIWKTCDRPYPISANTWQIVYTGSGDAHLAA
jgi:hypothetical protein